MFLSIGFFLECLITPCPTPAGCSSPSCTYYSSPIAGFVLMIAEGGVSLHHLCSVAAEGIGCRRILLLSASPSESCSGDNRYPLPSWRMSKFQRKLSFASGTTISWLEPKISLSNHFKNGAAQNFPAEINKPASVREEQSNAEPCQLTRVR